MLNLLWLNSQKQSYYPPNAPIYVFSRRFYSYGNFGFRAWSLFCLIVVKTTS